MQSLLKENDVKLMKDTINKVVEHEEKLKEMKETIGKHGWDIQWMYEKEEERQGLFDGINKQTEDCVKKCKET